jgi:hypothetical protein
MSVESRSAKRARIVGDHPHRGESGTVRDDLPMKLGMWRVELDACAHGSEACFAGPESLRALSGSEDPHA